MVDTACSAAFFFFTFDVLPLTTLPYIQFAGTVKNGFSGDQTGNLPLGVSAVNPPGSCPASTTPIPDGQQLVDITQNPGTPNGGGK